MWSVRDRKKLGSLQRDLPFLKDLIDYGLSGYPRVYLFVERLRAWVNWDKRVYLSFVRRGNIVLDVGANVGAHTVFLSHLVGNQGRVLAFEPLSANIDALKETVRRRSRCPNISIFQAAVGTSGDSGRRVVMTAPEQDLTQASLRVQAAGSWRQQSAHEYEVSLISLDAEREVRNLPSIDVIKIDVEGGELDVLKGGAQTIRRHHPLIYCEVYDEWAVTFGYTPADLFGFIRFLGYTGARVISKGAVHALPLERDPPPAMFETSSDVVFFTDKHRQLVSSFDKRYLPTSVTCANVAKSGLDCRMVTSQVSSFRTRVSLSALNLVARVVNRTSRRGHPGSDHNGDVARILVLELWNIGDVILAMPFLAQLRRLFPRAEIVLLARPFAAELLAGTGLVDEFIIADLTWTPADGSSLLAKALSLWRLSRNLRAHSFDLAFSARLHLREHILLALSSARRRIGFALGNGDTTLTDTIAVGDARHKVEDWLQLLGPFGGASSVEVPDLCISESERLWASGYVTSRGVQEDELLVGIHPGASLAEKRWPLERFREVVGAMAEQPGVRVLAFADPSGYGSELFAMPRVVAAQVGLRELMALIARCDLLVCNDSGPMHIAGALGVLTVAMFGSGIDQWFAPLGGGHEMLIPDQNGGDSASPATQRGIRVPTGIRSSQVLDAVGRAVQRLRGRGTFSRV